MKKLLPKTKLVIFPLSIQNLILKRLAKKSFFSTKYIRRYLKRKKQLDSSEWYVFQLLEKMRKKENGSLNSYKFNRKTHATMSKKSLFPYMVSILDFLWKEQAGMSLVTRLTITTLLNSQVSRQKAKTSVEKDFYKPKF